MKIATVGSGMIADRFIEAMSIVDGISLEAVFSRTEEAAKAFAQKHKANKYYTDLAKMLADKDIDAVYIASPNSLHYPQALQALKAKKHVLSEKPFTSTLAEAQELFKTAEQEGVFLLEAITNMHVPNFQIVKDNLKKVGNIRMVICNYSQFSKRYLTYLKHEQTNVFDTKFSGGSLVDINLYNVYFTIGLFGKPKSYKYYPNLGYNGIDTSGTMIFQYDNFIATLTGSKDSASDPFGFIQGDKGTIRLSQKSLGQCTKVELYLLEDNNYDMDKLQTGAVSIGVAQKDHMSYEISDFVKIVKEKDKKSYEKFKQYTLDVIEVMSKARQEAGIKFEADK